MTIEIGTLQAIGAGCALLGALVFETVPLLGGCLIAVAGACVGKVALWQRKKNRTRSR